LFYSPGAAKSRDEHMGFSRTAHLRTFSLPGGDRASRCPPRSALGLLFAMDAEEAAKIARRWFPPPQLQPLLAMLRGGAGMCPRTSSVGRLFDSVGAICGLPRIGGEQLSEISFEGQAAMALEFAAEIDHTQAYDLPLGDGRPATADWSPLIRGVIADQESGVSVGVISARFHNALGDLALAIAERAACSRVVLSGGCFQNALLTRVVRRRLSEAGFDVYAHEKVPPGDGGVSLGQAFIASRQLERQ